jgi:uncharacterized protein (DUF983 family)
MLWRGLRRRCPRCGAKGLFRSAFRLREYCPGCGYRFERETGFWMGSYLVNYAFTAVVLVALIAGYVIWLQGHAGGRSLIVVIVAAEVLAIALPLAFFRTAKSLWCAIDLSMRPLDPVEEAEAELRVAGGEASGAGEGEPPPG